MTRISRRTWLRMGLSGVLLAPGDRLLSAAEGRSGVQAAVRERRTEDEAFERGDAVPNFYVRAVTGPLQGKSVCYVCRNGDRPVVMILARKIIPRLGELLHDVDDQIDAHRADGLRGFGVFIGPDSRKLLPQVQTLAFENKLNLPLTLAAAPAEGPALRGLSDDAAVAVVLYRNQRVCETFRLADERIDESVSQTVVAAVQALAEGRSDSQ
jgi:hypothetical protein